MTGKNWRCGDKFVMIESQKVLNNIAISQIKILSGGDMKELGKKGEM